MTDIADHLHLGVASLYRYYKTKSNLVVLCGIHLWKKEIQLFDLLRTADAILLADDRRSRLEGFLAIFHQAILLGKNPAWPA